MQIRMLNSKSLLLPILALLCVGGCSPGGGHHSIHGSIHAKNHTTSRLAGSTIEASLLSKPQTRGYGEIQEDGTFSFESLHEGEILQGVSAGEYRLRIVLSDDDPQTYNELRKVIPEKYFSFQDSGWRVRVPTNAAVALDLRH